MTGIWGVFLWILWHFQEHLRTTASDIQLVQESQLQAWENSPITIAPVLTILLFITYSHWAMQFITYSHWSMQFYKLRLSLYFFMKHFTIKNSQGKWKWKYMKKTNHIIHAVIRRQQNSKVWFVFQLVYLTNI